MVNVGKAIKLTASIFKSPESFMCTSMADLRRKEKPSIVEGKVISGELMFLCLALWISLSFKKKKVSNLVQHVFHNTLHGMTKILLKVPPTSVNMLMLVIGYSFCSGACFHLCVFLN